MGRTAKDFSPSPAQTMKRLRAGTWAIANRQSSRGRLEWKTMTKRKEFWGRQARLRHTRYRRGRSGFTLIELLCACVIVGTCIAAIVSTWSFAFTVTAKADRQSVGYTIGRRAIEEIKETGFQDTAEGTTTVYYDSTGGNRSTTATSIHTYSV